jgi:hypothetical protein
LLARWRLAALVFAISQSLAHARTLEALRTEAALGSLVVNFVRNPNRRESRMATINTAVERLENDQTVSELATNPRSSGFVLEWKDNEAARAALKRLAAEADPAECDDTLEYLMKALNETRAEGGERELFV